jgi:hypothetical protein
MAVGDADGGMWMGAHAEEVDAGENCAESLVNIGGNGLLVDRRGDFCIAVCIVSRTSWVEWIVCYHACRASRDALSRTLQRPAGRSRVMSMPMMNVALPKTIMLKRILSLAAEF